jgi:hypothetical protein
VTTTSFTESASSRKNMPDSRDQERIAFIGVPP